MRAVVPAASTSALQDLDLDVADPSALRDLAAGVADPPRPLDGDAQPRDDVGRQHQHGRAGVDQRLDLGGPDRGRLAPILVRPGHVVRISKLDVLHDLPHLPASSSDFIGRLRPIVSRDLG
jgi:hypothetical protein